MRGQSKRGLSHIPKWDTFKLIKGIHCGERMPTFPCPDCGNVCSTLAKACPSCGRPFKPKKSAEDLQEYYCENCARTVSPDDNVCPKCGKKILERKTRRVLLTSKKKLVIPRWLIVGIVTFLVIFGIGQIWLYMSTSDSLSENEENRISFRPVEHVVTIKAAIVYKLGGAQPVAREKFYLVEKLSPELTGKDAGLAIRLGRIASFMKDEKPFDPLATNAIQTVVTDFEGIATFQNVPRGDYYILGLASTRGDGYVYWRLPVHIDGNKTILLDQNNAAELTE
jgi:RNA polymerase subunit RPABC4/transcription elongation factor Spt4